MSMPDGLSGSEKGEVKMLQAVEAVIILKEERHNRIPETALLSEAALAKDWNRPEEEAAWSFLQPGGMQSTCSTSNERF